MDSSGNPTAVRMTYPRDPVWQYLDYASMYDASLAPRTGTGSR